MAREGITFEQVAAAADALVGEGHQPSIRAIRERLGSGSPNTVHRHLVTWRSARPVAQAVAQELPAELSRALSVELARVAAQARAEVEQELVRVQAEAADLAAAGEGLEGDRDELAVRVLALTSERDQALATAFERAQEIQRLDDQVQREQSAAESARIELATARLRIDSQGETLAELREQLAAARQVLEASTVGRQQAEQRAAVLEAQEAAQRARADDLVARLQCAESVVVKCQEEVGAAVRKASDARTAEQLLQVKLEAVLIELESAKNSAQQAQTEAKKSVQEAAELRGRLSGVDQVPIKAPRAKASTSK